MLPVELHREAAGVFGGAYLVGPVTDRMWSRSVATYRGSTVHGVRDPDGSVASVVRSFDQRLAVPGGEVAAVGVSSVGVRLDRRRRGHLSALMRTQLEHARGTGAVAATLRATEGGIYRRFGYGVASRYATLTVDRRRLRLRPGAAAERELRVLAAVEALQVLPGVHDRIRGTRPGTVDRPLWWWTNQVARHLDEDDPIWVLTTVDAEGRTDGAALYTTQDRRRWESDPGRAVVRVLDLVGDGPGVELALWQGLLGVDLSETLVAHGRALDDVLPLACEDPRAARLSDVEDETWLRLLDVPAALAARSWGPAPRGVVLGVRDALLPANTGRTRVTSGGAEPTEEPADLELDVADLAAVYLGGTTVADLAAVGRVRADPDVVVAADLLLATPRQPLGGTYF